MSNNFGIIYSDNFFDFLDSLHDVRRVFAIKDALEEFARGDLELDPKDCKHFDDRVKIAIGTANVVVYYDLKNNDMIMISGRIIQLRAA